MMYWICADWQERIIGRRQTVLNQADHRVLLNTRTFWQWQCRRGGYNLNCNEFAEALSIILIQEIPV